MEGARALFGAQDDRAMTGQYIDFQTHTIAATVHGRFLVREGPPDRLLAGFHGYAETAEKHLNELLKIPGVDDWTIAAVQALHPFYAGRTQEVVASWMTPLDRQVDFLTFPGGRKFEIPFDLLVVFSTNLDPKLLADEAFLRRIANKIKIDHPMPEEFIQILKAECWTRFLPFDQGTPEYVVNHIGQEFKKPLCQCYARDIINQIFWAARYSGVEPRLTRETVQQACRAYFLSTEKTEKLQN